MSEPNQNAPELSPILLVDDDKQQLNLYAETLAPVFHVTTATSTREALRLLQEKAFKVIVCDYSMPGGDGLRFLAVAGEKFPHTQRILITGYLKPDLLSRQLDETALFRYLLKPVSLAELIKTVQDAEKQHDLSVAAG